MLDVFWILGMVVISVGLGGNLIIQSEYETLSSQLLPYSRIVGQLGQQFVAYDGVLNMYVGIPSSHAGLRATTLSSVVRDTHVLQETSAAVVAAAPSPAFRKQALAAVHDIQAYGRDAATVLDEVTTGHRAAAQALQMVGNASVTGAAIRAIGRLQHMESQRQDAWVDHVRRNMLMTTGATVVLAVLLGVMALGLRRRVTHSLQLVSAGLENVAAGDFATELPMTSIGEFEMIRTAIHRAEREIMRIMDERDGVIARQEETIRARIADADRYSQALEKLHAISLQMMRSWTDPAQTRDVLAQASTIAGADGVAIWILEPWHETYRRGTLPWDAEGTVPEEILQQGELLASETSSLGTVMTVKEQSVLILPWRSYRSGRGLMMMARAGEPWSVRDRQLAKLTATQIQLMADNVRLFHENQRRATTDSLTGLWNRWRYWDDLNAAGGTSRIGLLLVDLDHLKELNDTGGHSVGDAALRQLADALRPSAGESDRVYRIGGDEFVVLVQEATPDRCRAIYEKTKAALGPNLSFSAGIAIGTGEETVEALTQKADAALYRAKAGGRGRFAWADQPTDPETAP